MKLEKCQAELKATQRALVAEVTVPGFLTVGILFKYSIVQYVCTSSADTVARSPHAGKGLALPRESLRRDRPGGLTSPALHACGSTSSFAYAVVTKASSSAIFTYERVPRITAVQTLALTASLALACAEFKKYCVVFALLCS